MAVSDSDAVNLDIEGFGHVEGFGCVRMRIRYAIGDDEQDLPVLRLMDHLLQNPPDGLPHRGDGIDPPPSLWHSGIKCAISEFISKTLNPGGRS